MNLFAPMCTVFLTGNFEAQRLADYCIRGYPKQLQRFADTVREHFLYSCLLSDHVFQPTAHFYQSEITKWITNRYKLLFKPYKGNPPIASYGLSYRKDSYAEDAEEKAITYIGDFPCYHDPIIRSRLTSELNSLVEPHVRFGNLAASLSELIMVESESGGELFEFVCGITGSNEDTKTLLLPLRHIAEEHKYALIPEYLFTKTPPNLPSYYIYLMRITLLKCYTQIAEQLYRAPAQNALYPYYRGILLPYRLHYTDTQLFAYFMGLIPDTRDIIRKMSDKELLELKLSDSFQYFLYYYKSFVESLRDANIDEYRKRIVQEFEFQKELYKLKVKGVVNNQLVAYMMCRAIDETARNKQRTLARTKDIFSYREIPIYALVTEVLERFANKYERALNANLERWRYGRTEFQKTSKKIFTGGIQYEINLTLQEFLEEKSEIIGRLAKRFVHYNHPEGKVVDAEAIKQFLRQFETVERTNLALALLQNIDFMDRNRMAKMFRHYCQDVLPTKERGRIVLTNLGWPYDSSHLASYFLGDVGMELGIESADLRAILDNKDPAETVILFVDDNIGSGKQATDTFRDLLGLIREKKLREIHELQLTTKQIENLKKFKIRLFTPVGFEEGKKEFVKQLHRFGLNAQEPYSFLRMEEKIGCFHPASTIFDTPQESEACKTMCSEIGYQLFSDKAGWFDELKKERSLGYGNSQKLIVLFYNVPTSTLPMLWKRGRYKEKEWEPLFLRREKK